MSEQRDYWRDNRTEWTGNGLHNQNLNGGNPMTMSTARKDVKITLEEIQFLKECNTQVFLTKSVPAALGLTLFTELMHKYGYLKLQRGRRFLGACLFGFVGVNILHNFSDSSCYKRVMERYPRGAIATEYRRLKNIPDHALFGIDSVKEEPVVQRKPVVEKKPIARTEVDPLLSKNVNPGLDERNRPTLDQSYLPNQKTEEVKARTRTTYADLREKHRQKMEANNSPPTSDSEYSSPYAENQTKPIWSSHEDKTPQDYRAKKNKYGDVWYSD